MTTQTIPKTTFIELAELVEPVPMVPPLLSSPLKVSQTSPFLYQNADRSTDAKQARDLISVLRESKQNIDPRLSEMARFSGGGGGGRGRGGWRGRGGGGGHHGGTFGYKGYPGHTY